MKIRNLAAVAAITADLGAAGAIAQERGNTGHGQHMMGQGHMMMGGGSMTQMREMMDEMTKMMGQMRDMMAAAETGAQGGHDMSAMGAVKGDQGPSSKAFAEANARMHTGMDLEFSGDADVDFVKGMIAHHQGAVEMAEIVLKYGKDEELRTLATQIIAAQEPEIKFMQEWLAKKGK